MNVKYSGILVSHVDNASGGVWHNVTDVRYDSGWVFVFGLAGLMFAAPSDKVLSIRFTNVSAE